MYADQDSREQVRLTASEQPPPGRGDHRHAARDDSDIEGHGVNMETNGLFAPERGRLDPAHIVSRRKGRDGKRRTCIAMMIDRNHAAGPAAAVANNARTFKGGACHNAEAISRHAPWTASDCA